MKPSFLVRFALLFTFVVLATMARAAPSRGWTIQDLGALGSTGAVSTALNNRGDVVGYSTKAIPGFGGEVFRGFLWQNGTMRDLGAPISSFTQAMSINERGTIAVIGSGDRAFLWKDGQWIDMQVFGRPNDVNKFDAVTGHLWTNQQFHAFTWRDGILRDLGTLGGANSIGNAINDKGVVAGWSEMPGTNGAAIHAFVFDGAMTDLGTLGGEDSLANDVNAHGVVVGWSQSATGAATAFIWDGGPMRRLLDVGTTSSAKAINNHGAVVGLLDDHGFLYDGGVLTNLEQIAEVRAAGWTRLFPMDISDRGSIAGWGFRDGPGGGLRAFLLAPK